MDRETNKSRGFAFVEMPSEEEGNAALSGLNQKEIEGRPLSVSLAREKENVQVVRNSIPVQTKRIFLNSMYE